MSAVPEAVVEEVVKATSERMSEPTYGQVAVGTFAQAHPDVGSFITAHLDDLGGGEAVIHAVFHAEVVHRCLQQHRGRHLPPVTFPMLDEASVGDPRGRLATAEPALAAYLEANVEGEAMRRLLALVTLALASA
ncbi:MAG: hypothetical protein ACFCGT_22645 [Sandaracinaceae bacterium]